jgi:hypothetical protein
VMENSDKQVNSLVEIVPPKTNGGADHTLPQVLPIVAQYKNAYEAVKAVLPRFKGFLVLNIKSPQLNELVKSLDPNDIMSFNIWLNREIRPYMNNLDELVNKLYNFYKGPQDSETFPKEHIDKFKRYLEFFCELLLC